MRPPLFPGARAAAAATSTLGDAGGQGRLTSDNPLQVMVFMATTKPVLLSSIFRVTPNAPRPNQLSFLNRREFSSSIEGTAGGLAATSHS